MPWSTRVCALAAVATSVFSDAAAYERAAEVLSSPRLASAKEQESLQGNTWRRSESEWTSVFEKDENHVRSEGFVMMATRGLVGSRLTSPAYAETVIRSSGEAGLRSALKRRIWGAAVRGEGGAQESNRCAEAEGATRAARAAIEQKFMGDSGGKLKLLWMRAT